MSDSTVKFEIKKVNVKIVLVAIAIIIVGFLIYSGSKPKSGSERDAISEAKRLFKADMKSEWTSKRYSSVKFDEGSAEPYRNGDLYRINGDATVSLKNIWSTYDNGKNWDYYDIKMKYHLVYDLSWSDGEWKLEGKNLSELEN